MVDSFQALALLERGCQELRLPTETALELMMYLQAKNMPRPDKDFFSPSWRIDELQHWVLLETEVRDVVEEVTGKITHSTKTASLPDHIKVDRRLKTMNFISAKAHWPPNIAIWEDPGTFMHRITPFPIKVQGADAGIVMHYCYHQGRDAILECLTNPKYTCDKADLDKLLSTAAFGADQDQHTAPEVARNGFGIFS